MARRGWPDRLLSDSESCDRKPDRRCHAGRDHRSAGDPLDAALPAGRPLGRRIRPLPLAAVPEGRLMVNWTRSTRLLTPSQHVSHGTLRNSFDRRSAIIGTVQGTVGVMLAARLSYLAVAQNEKYQLAAESNRVNLSLIPPRRGWILDRRGVPLASNRADFRVDIIPERLIDRAATVATLSQLLRFTPAETQDLRDKLDKAAGFQPVQVADGL